MIIMKISIIVLIKIILVLISLYRKSYLSYKLKFKIEIYEHPVIVVATATLIFIATIKIALTAR